MRPSCEQLDVIDTLEQDFVVSAAAGAGKTYVLVRRYLRQIEQEGRQPHEILAITFTRKAAAQMKTRIVNHLREAGLYEEAQIAETGPIQTIHSFCERLLRENALEAGLDPNFEILADARASQLTTACIKEALAAPLDDRPHAEALISFLAGQRRYGENRSPYAKLESAVGDVLRELRSTTVSQLELTLWHLNPETLRDRWEQWLVATLSDDIRNALSSIEGGSLHLRLQQAYKALERPQPSYLRGKPDAEAEQQALSHTCGLVQLACEAWWRLEREMEFSQALDFTALESRAVRLVERSQVTRDRIRAQYSVVMIDEAQDLNPIQYKLLNAIDPSHIMMVGDVQQSIYGFRQADVGLFGARSQQVPLKRLSKNYRSDQGILRFVDHVFGSFWADRYKPMAEPVLSDDLFGPELDCEGVEVWRMPARDAALTGQYVKQLFDEGISPREITVLVRDSSGALEAQRGLTLSNIESRVAGGTERFYTRLEVRDLSNVLRAIADPFDDFALLACLRSPVVGVSMDAIVLLGADQPVFEKLEAFVSPVETDKPKLEKFLQWYMPLRAYADRLSAWEVLAEVFAKSDYLQALARRPDSDQLLANVRKLLALATQEPELGPLDYADRIREIQDLRHKEGDAPAGAEDANVVTIMTIHKAKGLEFPVVVIPQTEVRFARNAPDVVVEPRIPMVATKFTRGACLMHRFLAAGKKSREEQEELRVLYVGFTRAQKRLCISLFPSTNRDTLSKRLSQVLGASLPHGIKVRGAQESQSSPTDERP